MKKNLSLLIIILMACLFEDSFAQWKFDPIGGQLTSAPCALIPSDHPTQLHVYYKGINNHLWRIVQDMSTGTWSGHEDLGGIELTSAPSAITDDENRIHIYYKGPNNHLWVTYWPDKKGSKWYSAPQDLGGVELTSSPSAIHIQDKKYPARIHIYYRGPGNHLMVTYWPEKKGGVWYSAPQDLGDVQMASGPAAYYLDGSPPVDIFYKGPDNHLWQTYWPDATGSYSGGIDLGDVGLTQEPSAINSSVAASLGYGIDIYYRGQNNHLYVKGFSTYKYLAPPNYQWSASIDIGGIINSGPGAVFSGNMARIFVQGSDNALWEAYYIPVPINQPPPTRPTINFYATPADPPGSSSKDARINIGETATLNWQVSNCSSCVISLQGKDYDTKKVVLNVSHGLASSGQMQVTPSKGTYTLVTYTLTSCNSNNECSTVSRNVSVYWPTTKTSCQSYFFKYSNPSSFAMPCFTMEFCAGNATDAMAEAKSYQQQHGYGAYSISSIDGSQVLTGCP